MILLINIFYFKNSGGQPSKLRKSVTLKTFIGKLFDGIAK
jgi:hypothetical protein